MTIVDRRLAPCRSVSGAFVRLWVLGLAGAAVAASGPLPANLLAGPGLSELAIRLMNFANTALVLAALIGVGVIAAREVGLNSLIARRALAHHLPRGHAFHWVQAGVLLGAGVALLQWLFDQWFWQLLTPMSAQLLRRAADPASVSQLMNILLSAVNEELMLRWGLMSGLLWVFALLFRQRPGRPRAALAWVAIIGVSLLATAGQIPSLLHVMANELAGILLLHTTIASALAGIAYGWLFWKHGLEAAILAHMVAQAGLLFAGGG